MLNEKPALIIQAVRVVPMFAPIMTEIACASVSNPALTNETVITVVAVEDCTAAVTNIPVIIPVKRFVVIACSTWRSCEPAIFCKLSLIDFIPYIKRASEPISFKKIQIDIFLSNLCESQCHSTRFLLTFTQHYSLKGNETINTNPLQK